MEPEDLQDWDLLDTSSIGSSLTAIEDGSDSSESLIKPEYFNIHSNLAGDGDVEGDDGSVSQEIRDFGGKSSQSQDCSEKYMGYVEISENQGSDVNSEEIQLDSAVDVIGNENSRGDGGLAETLEFSGEQVVGGGGEGSGLWAELRPVDEGRKGPTWWKIPVELLKCCVFKVNPVWTFSLAAAIMGVVILRRRLSRMRQKSRSIPIKLAVENKKASQFMMRASRANGAFLVARRVPILRPLLLSAELTPWPVLNLR